MVMRTDAVHKPFSIVSAVPMKFAPRPAVLVTDSKGKNVLAIDDGYGYVAPCELSEESSKFLMSLEEI